MNTTSPAGTRAWIMTGFSPYAPFNVFYGSLIHGTDTELKAGLELLPAGVRRSQVMAQLTGVSHGYAIEGQEGRA